MELGEVVDVESAAKGSNVCPNFREVPGVVDIQNHSIDQFRNL
jgi:hypothetical protein